jgi:hypothetical protein
MGMRAWMWAAGLVVGVVGCSEYDISEKAAADELPPATTTTPAPPVDPPEYTEPDIPVDDPPDDPQIDTGTPPEIDTGTPPVVADPVGCADGTREGFLSQADYPDIAACSGGWTEPGITLASPATPCGRQNGDDSSNPEGIGCTAEDLCATGWHVCDGGAEVGDKSFDGCAGAVPGGTPDKTLFFAVAQHSIDGTVCDDSAVEANDVFGCGNLGVQLDASKNCGVLDRALASTSPDSCGFNEAEPFLGPWECNGGTDSHLREGELVTKMGCPGGSCSYDGQPVSSQDKGGVVCCRD